MKKGDLPKRFNEHVSHNSMQAAHTNKSQKHYYILMWEEGGIENNPILDLVLPDNTDALCQISIPTIFNVLRIVNQ